MVRFIMIGFVEYNDPVWGVCLLVVNCSQCSEVCTAG